MWPWYCYIIAAIFVISVTIGIPVLDFVLATKEYKEKEMEKKSVLDMMLDGWCDDCECDPAQCHISGKCLGDKSKENEDGSKEKSV